MRNVDWYGCVLPWVRVGPCCEQMDTSVRTAIWLVIKMVSVRTAIWIVMKRTCPRTCCTRSGHLGMALLSALFGPVEPRKCTAAPGTNLQKVRETAIDTLTVFTPRTSFFLLPIICPLPSRRHCCCRCRSGSILVIGNKFDPSTSMANSLAMAIDLLADARSVYASDGQSSPMPSSHIHYQYHKGSQSDRMS